MPAIVSNVSWDESALVCVVREIAQAGLDGVADEEGGVAVQVQCDGIVHDVLSLFGFERVLAPVLGSFTCLSAALRNACLRAISVSDLGFFGASGMLCASLRVPASRSLSPYSRIYSAGWLSLDMRSSSNVRVGPCNWTVNIRRLCKTEERLIRRAELGFDVALLTIREGSIRLGFEILDTPVFSRVVRV